MALRRSWRYLLVLVALAGAAVMTAVPASASPYGGGPGGGPGYHHGYHHRPVVCRSFWVPGHPVWRYGHRYWVGGHWMRTCYRR